MSKRGRVNSVRAPDPLVTILEEVKPGLNLHGLRHSLGKELYDLWLARETPKRMMAHECNATSRIYARDGDGGRMADKAVRALERKHRDLKQ